MIDFQFLLGEFIMFQKEKCISIRAFEGSIKPKEEFLYEV